MYVFNINYKCGMYNAIFSDYLLLSLSGCRVGCLKYATDQQRGSKEFDKSQLLQEYIISYTLQRLIQQNNYLQHIKRLLDL